MTRAQEIDTAANYVEEIAHAIRGYEIIGWTEVAEEQRRELSYWRGRLAQLQRSA
jgi:hypothetical protein